MDKQEIIRTLQMDVEIPDTVKDRAKEAFDKIAAMNREQGGEKEEEGKDMGRKAQGSQTESDRSGGKGQADKGSGNGKRRKPGGERINRKEKRKKPGLPLKRAAVIFIAATFACAGVTAAAAYFRWSRSMEEGMQITEEQKIQLEEDHAVAFAMQECTKQGVTITAEQSITDNYFSHIVFRIEGAHLPEGAEPAFEEIHIRVDGKDDFNWTGGFYDGLIVGPDGRAVYADGTPIDYGSDGTLEKYVMEDGSMEYEITLVCHEEGGFIDKPIHVELTNLGTVAKAEYMGTLVEDTWNFDWNLQGKESMETYVLQTPLGDSGALVAKAELSPISIHVEYVFPLKEVTEEGTNENGETIICQTFAEPPMLTGVKLKDGTLYPYLMDGGSMGYEEDDLQTYILTIATDRVIDVDQVDSLLFLKPRPNGNGAGMPAEEDFYVVPLR